MTVKAHEMQRHARLLRGERNRWQGFAGRELYGGRLYRVRRAQFVGSNVETFATRPQRPSRFS